MPLSICPTFASLLLKDVCLFVMFLLSCNLGLEHLDIEPKPESLLDFDVSE